MTTNLLSEIETAMKPFDCVVSQREGFIRVWNCYCGSIMMAYNRKLDAVAASFGLKAQRHQTAGPIGGSDWEDRLTAI